MYNSYDYSPYYGAAATAGASAASVLMITYFSLILLAIASSVISIIGMWKVFKKAGRGGWEAIVPFYNTWTLFEISGYKGSYIFFGFIPYAGIVILLVFQIKAAISLSRKFKKPGGFAALLVLVPAVGYCILGFNNDKYDEKLGTQRWPEYTKEEFDGKFCTYCGTTLDKEYKHCPKCGKKI